MWVKLSQTKNGLPASLAFFMNSLASLDEIVVAGFHALPGERAGILDFLLADLAPARLDGCIVSVRREGVHDPARPEHLLEVREVLLVGVVFLLPALLQR